MRKLLTVTAEIEEYDGEMELDKSDQHLLECARDALSMAYAPYSTFYVGAAVLMENGDIVLGSNQENVAYPSGLCAERVAVFAAAAKYPNVPFSAIAVTARSRDFPIHEPVAPCGACRQVLAEYQNRFRKNIRIILQGELGPVRIIQSIKNILPLMFTTEGLKKK